MKKKTLLTTTIALAMASAMTFAPVSYKVIDKVDAASAPASAEKISVATKLKGVYEKLNVQYNGSAVLANAFDAALDQAFADADTLDLATDLPNLYNKVNALGGTVAADLEDALVAFTKAVITDYKSNSTHLDDLSAGVEAKLVDLNAALQNANLLASGQDLTTDDAAKLLVALKESFLSGNFNYTNIEDQVFGALKAFAKAEYEKQSTNNSFSTVLQNAYSSLDDLEADFDTLKANVKSELNANASKKETYKKGALAFAIAAAQYQLEQEGYRPLNNSYTGSKVELYPNFLGIDGIPLSALDWSAGSHNIGVDNNGVLVLNVNGYGTFNINVTAKLKAGAFQIPAEFAGIELFSQQISVTANRPSSGGGAVVDNSLTLVGDYQQKAAAISALISDYLSKNPVLSNNVQVYGLKKIIEEQLRQALTVAAANATTTVNGVTTLDIVPNKLTTINNEQITAVLNTLKAALEAAGIKLDVAPTLTFNVGVAANAQLNINKASLDTLSGKGIANVAVRSGDAVIEAAVSQLTSNTKLTINKSEASNVQGAKSDVYSLSVKDANGKDVLGFKQQYRVTLPVNGDSSNVTVALLGNGSQTLIGGQYDPATKTITFYTNVLGDFVVVENKAEFNDISNVTWATNAIQKLADKGIIQGKGEGKFDPYSNITRAEFTALVVRALNLSVEANLTFKDVSENAWYHDVIAAAYKYDIIKGRSADKFDPNASITREEMASVAANALKAILGFESPANANEVLNKFNDGNKVAPVHQANVAQLANDGIVQGKGNSNYDPKGNATRAEVAVIIASILDLR